MLPGVGVSEYIIIAIAALVVIGPKDLPMLMRKVGAFINRLRGMAAEFRASFDEMARQSELDELRKQVEELRSGQLMQPITDELKPMMTSIENDVRAGVTSDWTGRDMTTPIEEPDTQRPPTRTRKPKAASGAKPPKAKASRVAPAKAASAKPTAKPRIKSAGAPKAAPAAKSRIKAAPSAKARPRAKGAKS